MELRILHTADCPRTAVLTERLAAVLDGRHDVEVAHQVVDDPDTAKALGMRGSPTVLLAGVDPFDSQDQPGELSCRTYRDGLGRPDQAPTSWQLRRAATPGEPPMEGGLPDRTALLDPADRAVHRAILRAYATTGQPPHGADLDRQAVDRLHEADIIRRDDTGRITVAYPFSGMPTAHRVRVSGGAEVDSMCAVDALGIPWMLGTDVVITSTDPITGETITVEAEAGRFAWQPATAVVYVGARDCDGPVATRCCGEMNFFATEANALAWAEANPDVSGKVFTQPEAEYLGLRVFGAMLEPSR